MNIDLNLGLWPRQMEMFRSPATEILFGGATEGGKSHAARVLLITFCLSIPGLQCVLIRKKYDDILKNHVEGPTGFKALLAPLIEAGKVKITKNGVYFPKGAIIAFQHCQDERQFDSAQGVEKHILVIDEATQISERLIRFFRGWVRMPLAMQESLPEEFKGKLPLILYTANPIGASVGYFRRNFVKARAAFEVQEVDGFLRQYIPSRAQDNPSVDLRAHHGRLAGMGDAALAKALDEGDWDAPIGDFIRQWDDEIHRVRDFIPPSHWFKFRSFDWGGAEPFSVGWWCVSDGEEFEDHEKRTRWFPRGALIRYREWYGCDPDDPSKGIDLQNVDIAKGIVARTHEVTSGVTITDSLPFQKRGGELMAEEFARNGVILTRGNTDREIGWKRVKDYLAGIDGFPMLYITDSCPAAADYLPALQRHPTRAEDAVEHGEATHTCDEVRLAVMTRPPIKSKPKERLPLQPGFRSATITPKQIIDRQRYSGRI